MGWINLAQDRDWWRALLNIVMNLMVPENTSSCATGSRSRRAEPHGVSYRTGCCLLTCRAAVEIFYLFFMKLKLKLIYDRRSVGQSVLVLGSHLEPMTKFLFSV
jgi:hypothetical protein